MGDKNDVTHIEEQTIHESGSSTNIELFRSDGVVLYPQPTADPNGEFGLDYVMTSQLN